MGIKLINKACGLTILFPKRIYLPGQGLVPDSHRLNSGPEFSGFIFHDCYSVQRDLIQKLAPHNEFLAIAGQVTILSLSGDEILYHNTEICPMERSPATSRCIRFPNQLRVAIALESLGRRSLAKDLFFWTNCRNIGSLRNSVNRIITVT